MTEPVRDLTERYLAMQKAQSFVRYVIALAVSSGDPMAAVSVFRARWPNSKHIDVVERAAVGAGSTASGNWGGPLAPLSPLAAEFVELIRPRTVIGRLQGLRRVPFNVRFPTQTAGASVGWIAEGAPARAGALAFADTTFGKSKIGGFIVITDELARSADPAAEMLIQRDLSNAIVAFSDQAFLDPALEAVVDVSPASVTNGATEIESTGDTAEEITADLKAAFAALAAAGIQMSDPYIVMKPTTALFLAGLENAAGVPAFPNVTVAGGSIWGVPVLTSASVGDRIVVLDAAEILLAEGDLEVEASNQATVEMAAPVDSPPDASTVMTSLWQENLTGVMVRRYIRWQRRRAGATAFVSGVTF